MSARTSPKTHQDIPVKVRVAPRRQARPAATPTATKPVAAVVMPPPVATRSEPRERSVAERKKMMWWMVAVGMFVVVIGWAFALGHELRRTGDGNDLFGRISDIFRTFKVNGNANASPVETEIRQLEDRVFPQF